MMKKTERDQKHKQRQWFCLPILTSATGLIVLVLMTALLLVLAFLETARSLPLLLIVPGVVLLGLSRQCIQGWQEFCALDDKRKVWDRQALKQMMALTAGALTTYLLSVALGLGAVIAAALVGVIAALLVKKTADAVYCGAFVGMMSQDLNLGCIFLVVAAVLASLIYVLSYGLFNGFGGKLGTIAFAGSVAAAVLLDQPFLGDPLPGRDEAWLIILFSVLGAVLTFAVSIRLKLGAVMASGLVGLLAGLLMPLLLGSAGQSLAVVVFCASFAGMSGQDRIANETWVGAAGLVAGLIYIYTAPHLGGMGGKLGAIAFGSTLAVSGLASLLSHRRGIT